MHACLWVASGKFWQIQVWMGRLIGRGWVICLVGRSSYVCSSRDGSGWLLAYMDIGWLRWAGLYGLD